jgi:hypothetical protein
MIRDLAVKAGVISAFLTFSLVVGGPSTLIASSIALLGGYIVGKLIRRAFNGHQKHVSNPRSKSDFKKESNHLQSKRKSKLRINKYGEIFEE